MNRAIFCAIAFLWSLGAVRAGATCNVIPGVTNRFGGAMESIVDRPFAIPGDFVDITSPSIVTTAADHVVTIVFAPSPTGPRNIVVLAAECGALAARTTTCAERTDVASITCLPAATDAAAGPVDLFVPTGTKHLRVRFPDTDRLFRRCEEDPSRPCSSDGDCATGSCSEANDNLTFAGPATIAVTSKNVDLPCGPEESICDPRLGLLACIGTLFDVDAKSPGTIHKTFPHFTALPPPNDYSGVCEPPSPCTRQVHDFRFTVDVAGNLLVPMDWRAVLVRRDEVPVARLLRGATDVEAFQGRRVPIRIPGRGVLGSFSPEGSKLPPIFEPQLDVSDPDMTTLFGTADAPAGVLRVARHDAPHPQCIGGVNDRLPCRKGMTDCEGGNCADAICLGGANAGATCDSDAQCAGGECGAGLFEFRDRVLAGVGPIVIRRDQCLGGADTGAMCTDDAACPGGQCGRFRAQALNPVPLDGLNQSETLDAFVVPEALSDHDVNEDGDTFDDVLQLTERTTGNVLVGSGIAARPRAVVRIRQPPFSFPAVALDGDLVGFLESEPGQGYEDVNGNHRVFDAVLRVFRRGTSEVTDLLPDLNIPVDAAPLVNGRSLAIFNGSVFFRSPEAARAPSRTAMLSFPKKKVKLGTGDGWSDGPAISADGNVVAFSSASSRLILHDGNRVSDVFATDGNGIIFTPEAVSKETANVRVSVDARGAQARTPPPHYIPASVEAAASADGRFIAFTSESRLEPPDRNRLRDVFIHDRDADGNGTFDEPGRVDVGGSHPRGMATFRASVAVDGSESNGDSTAPSLDASGGSVAFSSVATNLVEGDTNGGRTDQLRACDPRGIPPASVEACRDVYEGSDVFVRDLCSQDAEGCAATERVSVASDRGESDGPSNRPAISADGRFVAFESIADNLVGDDTNGVADVFVRDRCRSNGVMVERCVPKTERVSLASPGGSQQNLQGNDASVTAAISGNGRFVAFTSSASNLVAGDTNGAPDVFVHDRVTASTVRVSASSDGVEADGTASGAPALSFDGRFVAFASNASNLILHDTNQCIVTSGTCIDSKGFHDGHSCSRDSDCVPGTCALGSCIGGPNHRHACASSSACPGGGRCVQPNCSDAFVHDLLTGFTARVSVFGDDEQLEPHYYWAGAHPTISADGERVAFDSYSFGFNVFVRGADSADPVADVTGNSRAGETVLQVLSTSDMGAQLVGPSCPATQVAVAEGSLAAFLRPESAGPAPRSCPLDEDGRSPFSLNGDADSDDEVVQLWSPGSVRNLGLAAHALALSDQWVAAVGSEPGRNDVEVHAVGDGTEWQRTRQTAETVQICGAVVAFITDEATQGAKLNGDDDQTDRVLQLYDPARDTIVHVGQAAEEFVCNSKLVAFRTSEEAQGENLNGDTDGNDFVLQTYDISRPECLAAQPPAGCLRNSGQAAIRCRLEACDPRVPYRLTEETVTFLTLESDQGGRDLNGDGDDGHGDDLVLQVFHPPDTGTSVAAGLHTSRHVAAATSGAVDTSEVLASVSAGICTVGGKACATDENCPGGTCFVPPGGCIADTGTPCDPTTPYGPEPCAGACQGNGPCVCEPDTLTCAEVAVPCDDDSGCTADAACKQGFCATDTGIACAVSTNPCARGFCDPATRRCEDVTGSCAVDADCKSLGPDYTCNNTGQRFQRLTNPLTALLDGGKVFTSAGRCVETLVGTSCLSSPCKAPAFCGPDGTCRREYGTCRTIADCPVQSDHVECKQDLVVVTTNDGE